MYIDLVQSNAKSSLSYTFKFSKLKINFIKKNFYIVYNFKSRLE